MGGGLVLQLTDVVVHAVIIYVFFGIQGARGPLEKFAPFSSEPPAMRALLYSHWVFPTGRCCSGIQHMEAECTLEEIIRPNEDGWGSAD